MLMSLSIMPVPTMENANSHVAQMAEDRCNSDVNATCYGAFNRGGRDIHTAYYDNMIFMQVNAGETFTVQDEDGSCRRISGPCQVPMVSHNGDIPPIHVPPGYVSQVIEENGIRRIIVLPSSAARIVDGHSFMGPIHHPHPIPMHALQPSHAIHPGAFPPTVIPNCRPDAVQFIPWPVLMTEDMTLAGACSVETGAQCILQPSYVSCMQSCYQHLLQYQCSGHSCAEQCYSAPVEVQLGNIDGGYTMQPAPLKVAYCTLNSCYGLPLPVSTAAVESTSKVVQEEVSSSRTFGTQVNMYKVERAQEVSSPDSNELDTNNTTDVSDSSLTSLHQNSQSNTSPSEMHPRGSPQPQGRNNQERFTKKRQERQQHSTPPSNDKHQGASSVTSSPASTSSFAPSPSRSPDDHINSSFSNGHQTTPRQSYSITQDSPNITMPVQHTTMSVRNVTFLPTYSKQQASIANKPSASPSTIDDDRQSPDGTSQCTDPNYTSDLVSYQTIAELLSAIRKPEVKEIKSKSAHIVWDHPLLQNATDELKEKVKESCILFELHVSTWKKDSGKFRSVYSGKEKKYILNDLRPASNYTCKVYASYNTHKGTPSEVASFHTLSSSPEAPSPPKLGTRTKNSLLLKWNAPADNGEKISKYHLEWDDGVQGGTFRLLHSNPQKQYKVVKLSPAHAYAFRLAAENKIGKSGWSSTISHSTCGTMPSVPDAPRLTRALVKSLTLSWTKPTGEVSGYTLEMNDESTGYGFLPVYDGLELKHTAKNLQRSSHYKFRLLAYNKDGKSRPSDVVSYLTCPDKPLGPSKPQVKGNVHARFFHLCWDAPKDNGGSEVLEYVMEMSSERGHQMTVIYKGIDQECLVEDLEPGHSYRLRVSCATNAGASAPSEVTIVTTPPVIPGPCNPPMLTMRPKPTCLSIGWDPPTYNGGTDISKYELECIAVGDTVNTEASEAYKGPDLECSVGMLRPGTKYSFTVRAANKVGIGPWSDRMEAVTSPGAPEKPDVPEATVLGATSIHLQWREPGNNGAEITNYRLQWGGAESSMSVRLTGPVLAHQLQSLKPDTVYFYSIQAVNSTGQSSLSDVGTATTPASSPDRVENVRLGFVATDADDEDGEVQYTTTATSIAIQWDKPNDNGAEIAGYKIHVLKSDSRADPGEPSGDLHEIDETLSRLCINNLDPDTGYSVKVCAVNNMGCGSFSQTVLVRTKPLPPDPPVLTCVQATASSVKLKWDDRSDSGSAVQYLLQMKDKSGRRGTLYRGSRNTFKATKLSENTTYSFRISASNSEGEGPFSEHYSFSTHAQAPPNIETPTVSGVESSSCEIDWMKVAPMKGDPIRYRLSFECVDPNFKTVEMCDYTNCKVDCLSPNTAYRVRIAAVRLCSSAARHDEGSSSSEAAEEGQNDLQGLFSNFAVFTTKPSDDEDVPAPETPRFTPLPEKTREAELPKPPRTHKTSVSEHFVAPEPLPQNVASVTSSESMSDDKMAAVLLAVYLLSAILLAFALQFIYVK